MPKSRKKKTVILFHSYSSDIESNRRRVSTVPTIHRISSFSVSRKNINRGTENSKLSFSRLGISINSVARKGLSIGIPRGQREAGLTQSFPRFCGAKSCKRIPRTSRPNVRDSTRELSRRNYLSRCSRSWTDTKKFVETRRKKQKVVAISFTHRSLIENTHERSRIGWSSNKIRPYPQSNTAPWLHWFSLGVACRRRSFNALSIACIAA